MILEEDKKGKYIIKSVEKSKHLVQYYPQNIPWNVIFHSHKFVKQPFIKFRNFRIYETFRFQPRDFDLFLMFDNGNQGPGEVLFASNVMYDGDEGLDWEWDWDIEDAYHVIKNIKKGEDACFSIFNSKGAFGIGILTDLLEYGVILRGKKHR